MRESEKLPVLDHPPSWPTKDFSRHVLTIPGGSTDLRFCNFVILSFCIWDAWESRDSENSGVLVGPSRRANDDNSRDVPTIPGGSPDM